MIIGHKHYVVNKWFFRLEISKRNPVMWGFNPTVSIIFAKDIPRGAYYTHWSRKGFMWKMTIPVQNWVIRFENFLIRISQ